MATLTINPTDLKTLAPLIWARIRDIRPVEDDLKENWILTEEQRINCPKHPALQKLLDTNSNEPTAYLRNVHLRNGFAKLLKDPNVNSSTKVACYEWIVKRWGNIKSHDSTSLPEKLEEWRATLGDFSRENVQALLNEYGFYNISSWSKILAFADYETYAVYDTRVAVALNIVLHELGTTYLFKMPPPQNKDIFLAIVAITDFAEKSIKRRDKYLQFYPYLELLNAIVKYSDAKDILEVELHLFSIAPRLARAFWRCRKKDVDPVKVQRAYQKLEDDRRKAREKRAKERATSKV